MEKLTQEILIPLDLLIEPSVFIGFGRLSSSGFVNIHALLVCIYVGISDSMDTRVGIFDQKEHGKSKTKIFY